MTNTSVITYDPSIVGDKRYLQIERFMSANPYLEDFNPVYGEDSLLFLGFSGAAVIDVTTGEVHEIGRSGGKNNVKSEPASYLSSTLLNWDDASKEVKEYYNQSKVVSVEPGKIVVESPNEVFWYSYAKTDASFAEDEPLLAEIHDNERAVVTKVNFAGRSEPSEVVHANGHITIDGDNLKDKLQAKAEAYKALKENSPETPAEESEPQPSAPEPEPEPEPEDTTSEESGTIPSDDPAATDEHADETDNSGDNMAKYDELAAAKGKLIRKALGGFIMVAPMDVKVPEKIFADKEGNFVDFKKLGFTPLGWLTKGDGINFSRETEQAEVESFGAQEPTRVDFTKDTTSAAFNCQETNKKVLELYYSQDLSEVKPDSETGEISFEQRDPETIYRRMIYIAHDGKGKDAKYIVKIMPKATISEVQEQAWSSESELAYGMTAKASKDDDLGYSVRHVFGGPGFEKLYADMGFTKPKTASSSGNTASQ